MSDSSASTTSSTGDNMLVITMFVASMALIAAAIGIGFGWRAIDEAKAGGGTSVASVAPAMVSLGEFKIGAATIARGGSLMAMNDGSTEHNLTVENTKFATANLAAGGSETLNLADLAPGTYTMFCSIPGHRQAGMEATLTVTEGGSAAASPTPKAPMDYAAMTKAMTERMSAFPATTEGVGNQPLAPTSVNGKTKVFDVTAAIGKWEVSPGKSVDAWMYNGTVPGPSIHLNVGDHVQLRFHNKLPVASDVHLHGLNVDNKYDGVAPLTQPLVQPGDSFTYEFTADQVALAMYHPHFMSQIGMPNGLFGTIVVGQVPLPLGRTISGVEHIPDQVDIAQEIPMVLNDSGVIGFSLNGKSFPATAPIVANTGDWVLVDYFNEGTQIHPMHLHQFDQIVVAEDGFALDQPYTVDTLNVAPGNRFSVLVHLDKPGTWVWHCHILPHVEADDGMFGMVTAVVVK